jgi:hypothetical protein
MGCVPTVGLPTSLVIFLWWPTHSAEEIDNQPLPLDCPRRVPCSRAAPLRTTCSRLSIKRTFWQITLRPSFGSPSLPPSTVLKGERCISGTNYTIADFKYITTLGGQAEFSCPSPIYSPCPIRECQQCLPDGVGGRVMVCQGRG